MADKSPRQHLAKKSGKSIKEKRLEKKSKSGGQTLDPVADLKKKR